MTGVEHYKEGERILAAATSFDRADMEGFTDWARVDLAALAQAHFAAVQAAAYLFPQATISAAVKR